MLVWFCVSDVEALAPSRDEIVEVLSVSESLELLNSERIWLDWRIASARHLANSSLLVVVDCVTLLAFVVLSLVRDDVLPAVVPAAAECADAAEEVRPTEVVDDGLVAVELDDAAVAAADDVGADDEVADVHVDGAGADDD